MDKLVECCESFINALCDILNDMVDKLSDIFTKSILVYPGAYCEDEYYQWLRLESEKKKKEHLAREFFEMQMKHTKTSKGHKFILMNRKFAPRSWTGKNYKKGG